ncbi:MAG: Na+/H+ antiporter NhaA, partial [Gemmatimonadaceae bacterium]|nr:Na+/H+ antiporter NhaA [Chitinophagaceae bacterium]
LVANSGFGEGYLHFWHREVGFVSGDVVLRYPIEIWVNDGLMAIFFLLVGLEIEREIYIGELSSLKNALLPVFAAIGGMIVPALIHFSYNAGSATSAGFGIPMATDIAFALGILSLLGNKVPIALKVFLTAFAIIDDLGAIIVIAIFYTKSFSFFYFGIAMAIWAILFAMNRLKINGLIFYLIPGILMWYCMLQSGVHATISGIILAFAIPFGNGDEKSTSYRLQHFLHKPVAFLILPIFALANTGVVFSSGWGRQMFSANSLGIFLGLVVGKPLGVLLFTFTAVKMRITQLGENVGWKHIFGASLLGGIGFTMSIFITLLAFNDGETVTSSKIAVLISSLTAGLIGYLYLKWVFQKSYSKESL